MLALHFALIGFCRTLRRNRAPIGASACPEPLDLRSKSTSLEEEDGGPRGDTDARSTASSGAHRPARADRGDRRPPRRPAAAGRTRLLAVRRRCARRRPARARDLHAAGWVARPRARAGVGGGG